MLLSMELPSLPGLPAPQLPFKIPRWSMTPRIHLRQRWPRLPQPQAVAVAELPAAAVDATAIPKSTVIVGGGPTGLAAAIMLARLGWSGIQVLERLPEPPSPKAEAWGDPARSYNIGLGARGQGALQQLGVWEDVLRWCAPVVGRRDWRPDGTSSERIYTNRGYVTQVLQRDRLASCLLAHLRSRYGDKATVTYDAECEAVLSWPWEASLSGGGSRGGGASCGGGGEVAFRVGEGGQLKRLEADLIIGCDGIKSAVRAAMESDPSGMRKASGEPLRVVRYKEQNARVFRAVLLKLKGDGWRNDLNYSAQLKGDITLEALPTKEGMFVGVVLHRPGDAALAAVKTAEDARSFFSTKFPQFYDSISSEEFQNFATRKTFSLPGFCYCGPVLNRGAGALLLGDAIHVVKPYFGLGANSALEDVMVLEECLVSQGLGAPGPIPDKAAAAAAGSALAAAIKEDAETEAPAGANVPLEAALRRFTAKRAAEAKAMVKMSRTFDNTGIWGAITFIIPIILDSLSYNLLPQVFAPNSIAYLQKAGVPFTQVRARKARDRALQVVILSVLAAAAYKAAATAVRAVLPLLRPYFGI